MNKLLGIVVALIILVVILIYFIGGTKDSRYKANIPPPAKYPDPPTLPVESN
ncbi:hypothetical protein [Cysteiniphilum halobium]|uniref:hypothetical protein n=1 Tax=Cysteiniphilum halobium TaxID=2219059 RepID=UPI003F835760